MLCSPRQNESFVFTHSFFSSLSFDVCGFAILPLTNATDARELYRNLHSAHFHSYNIRARVSREGITSELRFLAYSGEYTREILMYTLPERERERERERYKVNAYWFASEKLQKFINTYEFCIP